MSNLWKDIVRLVSRLDEWANKVQPRWPKFLRVNTHDLSLAGRIISRLFKLGLILVFFAGIIWAVYWFQYYGPRPEISNLERQHTLPTLEPTATALVNTNPWQNEEWMSSAEALNLRLQTNVVNLAYLQGGGAKYSRNHSLILTSVWQEIKPLGMSELSVEGTSIAFRLNSQKYVLNTYQPFVDAENPSYIYVVDLNGRTWRTNVDLIEVVLLEDAVNSLPIVINPNLNLSFTY